MTAVVVNYNGGAMNIECIRSLLCAGELEIVLVDNGSTDGSAESVESEFGSRAIVIRTGQNLGFARGCNIGARRASGDYLLFFNNDATANGGMTANLLEVFRTDPTIGVAGPAVLEAGSRIVQSTGYSVDRWGFPEDATSGLAYDRLPSAPTREAFYVSGCALMVPHALFDELGGFDEGMFMFAEDVDLCWRAWLAGKRVVTVRGACCEHIGGATVATAARAGTYRASAFRVAEREKNTMRMMLANLGSAGLLHYVLLRVPVLIFEALAAFVLGRTWLAGAYSAALCGAVKRLPDTLRRRRSVQGARRVPDSAITRLWSRHYAKAGLMKRRGIPARTPD